MNALAPITTSPAAAVVLFDQDKFDAFYAKLKADVDAVPVDLTTKKGRDAIASVAAKVRTEKASIDKDRLRLTKEWRDNTALVNGAWNDIKERMDALAIEARKPLTEWEEAEKVRVAECDAIINKLSLDGVVTLDDTAETVRQRGKVVWETEIDPERFSDKFEQAVRAKEHAVDMLKVALARLIREEEERAELERLRADAAARAEADRVAEEEEARKEAERIAAEESKAEAERQAALAEERRIAVEQAEAERIERAKAVAEERAKREAEAAAEAERQRIQREHDAALAAERRRAEDAEAAAQAERDRAAKEEADRKAEADRIAAEQAKREASQKHRSAVMGAAKEAIMTCGVDEETAKKIVLLIRAGEVPNIRLEF